MTITAEKSRGKFKGFKVVPHKYSDGTFVVSLTRFAVDQIKISTIREIEEYVRRGYGLRMSNPDLGINSPSLIVSAKISV